MVAGAERPFEFLTLNLANQFDKEWFVTLFLHAMSDAGTLIDRGELVWWLQARMAIASDAGMRGLYDRLLDELWPAYEASCEAALANDISGIYYEP